MMMRTISSLTQKQKPNSAALDRLFQGIRLAKFILAQTLDFSCVALESASIWLRIV